jgi:hypothetical protein
MATISGLPNFSQPEPFTMVSTFLARNICDDGSRRRSRQWFYPELLGLKSNAKIRNSTNSPMRNLDWCQRGMWPVLGLGWRGSVAIGLAYNDAIRFRANMLRSIFCYPCFVDNKILSKTVATIQNNTAKEFFVKVVYINRSRSIL